MSRSTTKKPTKKQSSSPLRVILRCSWDGSRLTVPPTDADGNDSPIRGSTTLSDLLRRLQPLLPAPLFQEGVAPSATLVCLRKVVVRGDWETTTLKQILDGDDGSAGVILTLDLGGSFDYSGGGDKKKKSSHNPVTSAIQSAASKLNVKPVAMSGAASASAFAPAAPPASSSAPSSGPVPMDTSDASNETTSMETTTTTHQNNPTTPMKIIRQTPDQAWAQVLQKNFDATTKDCLTTLLKIIDNLLSRPHDPKVRSIRCANAAFERKVGRCVGAFDFLYSMGFLPKYPAIALGGRMGETASSSPEMLEMTSENESREVLLNARKVLIRSATMDLGMEEEDLPPLPKDPPPASLSTPAAASAGQQTVASSAGGFNIYKTHSHNVQSAAVGAPDPYNNASSVSVTERQLQQLQSKKSKLEREMQAEIELDRGLAAYRPGSSGPTGGMVAASGGGGRGGIVVEGKGDSSLVAARMKRMEEERKKREEGGFTTKAMRDLEKMKKAKVYSHAQIRINFSDGTHLHAKFLPSEKVSKVRSIIQSSFNPSIGQSLDFDLYVAPPRRLLIDSKTLDEEELVPAAKIHVSWKVGGSPPNNGNFLREELFAVGSGAAFPDAKPVVEERKKPSSESGNAGSNTNNNNGDGPSKEELLMQRMMGKTNGLLGGRSSKKPKDDGSKKDGKPKWFK